MASTVPAKSQPLHNFPLSHLKWSSGHQRPRSSSAAARLASPSPHRSPPFSHGSPQHHSPLRQSVPAIQSQSRGGESTSGTSPVRGGAAGCGEDSGLLGQVRQSPLRPGVSDDSTAPLSSQSPIYDGGKSESSHRIGKPVIEYRRHSRNSVSSNGRNGTFRSSSVDRDDSVVGRPDKKLKAAAALETDNKESRSSKILIKIKPNTSKLAEEVQGEEEGKSVDNEEEGKLLDAFDDEEPLPKIWNLRPRKPIRKSLNLNGSGFKNGGLGMQEKRSQSPQVNPCGHNNRSDNQKKEKRKINFSLLLSREEIEEDMYAMFGSKITRRPKKKQKMALKLLDNIFPGAWLSSVTVDSYKVSEHPAKA
ncbi:OLC1v1038584C2 [Oldenlandia corymbosa var. corymbosa]|uniref:OLC1v1038584C2 n=1 Tax=Oldenlandia corymbosa var. corymbosa TaxID=529605 RepID=A0AAV1D036_OLDCO|nr:OLC1v1038584C2 [Oldenlandia corymbosa var. corymbosa]